jgi:hypothetical protein
MSYLFDVLAISNARFGSGLRMLRRLTPASLSTSFGTH